MRIVAFLIAAGIAAGVARAQSPNPEQLFHDALAAQQRGDDALAVRKYQELLKRYPASLEVRANLGAALARLNRYDEAIVQYRAVLNDSFVVAVQPGECRSQIGAHLEGGRIALEELLIFADRQRIVPALLCCKSVVEELFGIRGLRASNAGGDSGGDEECHDAHRFQDSGLALS